MSQRDGGRLVVVGTGIRSVGQLTMEAMAWLKVADLVLHLVVDPVAEELIDTWQPDSNRSLRVHYREGGSRRDAYHRMVAEIVAEVTDGKTVCVAMYGHPAVFARPVHLVTDKLRQLGYPAEILPGISAQDCLFADLGVDPGDGCLSFEATNFFSLQHRADPSVHLLLWQVGMLGDWTYRAHWPHPDNLQLLVEKLSAWYPAHHQVIAYQAAVVLNQPARVERVPLRRLPEVRMGSGVTLYVPPATPLRRDPVFADRLQRYH